MFNEVTLLGRIGQTPELKIASNNETKICHIGLATEDMRQPKEKRKTMWHRLTLFNRQAEVMCEYCDKGSLILVKGKIEYGEYEKDGVKMHTTNIIVNSFQIMPSGKPREESTSQENGGFPF